jgi:hypothetical protein
MEAAFPLFTGTVMDSVTPLAQSLPMLMVHGTTYTDCQSCHTGAGTFPGVFHATFGPGAQPTACNTCHTGALPLGFVGTLTTTPPRTPQTGEMRHDAVAWTSGAPTATRLTLPDCGVCHTPPSSTTTSDWVLGLGALGLTQYHSALAAASLGQPAQCLDCHANTRPTPLLTSGNSSVAEGRTIDHQSPWYLGECVTCHAASATPPVTTWTGGKFHNASNSASLTTCLPCHSSERPTSTTGWQATYTRSPFDYVTNSLGLDHGAGLDCVTCHQTAGTGTWGTNQNWKNGDFAHASTPAVLTSGCVNCHSSQRPDLLWPGGAAEARTALGFDHAADGTGECGACHGATRAAGSYLNLWLNGTTTPTAGGDWKGGKVYPADALVASTDQFIDLKEWQLVPDGTRTQPFYTQTPTVLSDRRYNAMLHTSTQVDPTRFGIWPDGGFDTPSTCWHCHTNTGGSVTSFANGTYHSALDTYRATVGGAVAPIAQPTTGCNDCHSGMLPPNVVMRDAGVGSLELQPMDHSVVFPAAVTFVGGRSVTSIDQLDCSTCHARAGNAWNDGAFHTKVTAGTPTPCVDCHLLLMTKTASANLTYKVTGGTYEVLMDHWAPSMPFQSCETCHEQSLAMADGAPASNLWGPITAGVATATSAQFHAVAGTQPTACVSCHTVSTPAGLTQSTEAYVFAQGGTTTNGGSWMSHAHTSVAGKDCVVCHTADADASPAWSRGPPAAAFHLNALSVTTCNGCHGAPGASNNLPSGLTDSTTRTTSSVAMDPKPFDQLTHADRNVTSHECGFCHTQVGSSTVADVSGKEWAQASFHKSFTGTGTSALVVNGTTTRCSNCHLNVMPTAGQTFWDHAPYTSASGTTDCALCHNWPGTGTAAAPNWLGAVGGHGTSGSTATWQTLDCNSCHGLDGSSTVHLSVAAASHFGGITNGNNCITCHLDFSGFKGTALNLLYPHTNATANAEGCGTCHQFADGIYTTLTTTPALTYPAATGGHTFLASFVVTGKNGSISSPSFTSDHTNSKMVLCGACHQYASTTAATNIWTFRHEPSSPGISRGWTATNGCAMCHNSKP